MKKYLPILIIPIFMACSEHNVGVVGDKRLQIEGSVVDVQENPVQGLSVKASGSQSDYRINATPREVLGESTTDTDGAFSFVSLDTHNSYYAISINHPDDENYRAEYLSLHFLDSLRNETRGLAFNLDEVVLPAVQNFQLEIHNISSEDTLFYRYEYENTEQYQALSETSFPAGFFESRNKLSSGGRILPDGDSDTVQIQSLENSNLSFQYKLSETAENDSINIEITPEDPVYEFSN